MPMASVDSGQVVRWVSESLRQLVRAHIPLLAAESAVVFDSPAEMDAQSENKLSVYLFQLEHNPWLRNLPPTLDRRPSATDRPSAMQMTPAPLVVDLMYTMVPYAKSAEIELVLADELLRLFHDVPALEGKWLHQGLRDAGNERIEIVPRATSLDGLRDIWSGFHGKAYKLTKLYTLTPVRIPSTRPVDVDMVTNTDLSIVNTRPLPADFNEAARCTD